MSPEKWKEYFSFIAGGSSAPKRIRNILFGSYIETIENFIDQYRVRVIDGVPEVKRMLNGWKRFIKIREQTPLPAEERRKSCSTTSAKGRTKPNICSLTSSADTR